MIWQDLTISIANLLFTYSLSHQIYHNYKNKKTTITYITSGLTAIGLFSISVAFFSLKLYYSGLITVISTILWATIFIQKYIYK